MPSGVHDSAFIVNAFRSRKCRISKDRFAALWITEETENWANKYVEKVGETEILVHALRHRFFLECLQRFFDKTPNGAFINIGAGFTNYPYLITSQIDCCEVDTPVNINYKRKKLAEFELKGSLYSRATKFISVKDLNNQAEILKLESTLREWLQNRPSFILFEGVFFYLRSEIISFFYGILSSLQRKGDIVASTSFRPEESNKLIFQRLVNYCKEDYGIKQFEPTTVETKFYREHPFYSLSTHQNYFQLSRKFAWDEKIENLEDVLEEDVYILEKL